MFDLNHDLEKEDGIRNPRYSTVRCQAGNQPDETFGQVSWDAGKHDIPFTGSQGPQVGQVKRNTYTPIHPEMLSSWMATIADQSSVPL